MAIVERTTTTRTSNLGTTTTDEADAGTGILVVLAIIVALAAAYFAYDYYAAPMDEPLASATSSTMDNGVTVTTNPDTAPARQ